MIGIYKFENKINHNIYIGQSIDIERRYKDHINRAKNLHKGNTEFNSPLHCAIRKYGIENFDFTIIEECINNKQILNKREKYWINYYDSYNNGYNCTSGGDTQEVSVKFDNNFINKIQQLLLTTNETYVEISKRYNISTGRISEINTGKVGFNKDYIYPLRPKKNNNTCIDCGISISPRSTRCNKCEQKHRGSISDKIDRNILKDLIRTKTFVDIGKQFKVSDNAIKKWCDKFNLPRTKREINSYTDEEWAKI